MPRSDSYERGYYGSGRRDHERGRDRDRDSGRDRDRERERERDRGRERDRYRNDKDRVATTRDRSEDGAAFSRRSRRSKSRSPRSTKPRAPRDISSSRERSRERERRRRRMQAECILRAGGFQKIADSEGKEPVRLFWDGFQWVAKTGHSQSALQNDPGKMNSTRKLRRLYFGNLPLHLGLNEQTFQELVWMEMKNRGYCNNTEENPVLCVWFAKDKGNYGFVEFASVEETERALQMDGMLCLNVPLKVSRPNDYSTASQQQSQAMALMGQQSAQLLQAQQTVPGLIPAAALATAGNAVPGLATMSSLPQIPDVLPTRFVRFREIIHEDDLEDGDTWESFLEDIREGCGSHGIIAAAAVVTPANKDKVPGMNVGDVFLEFADLNQAEACVRGMEKRQYLSRQVQAERVPEEVYASVRVIAST